MWLDAKKFYVNDFFLYGGTGSWTKYLTHAQLVLYQLSYARTPSM